ncbi:ribosomal RNA processing protein 36 homolog isoform X2 [Acropora millepora]|uniref:ribosomal RNA processing protein 36 homolog isoform X2 n=1 Tax=Acropora millepora TaxID=45264 RepID=UPI0010FC8C5F|nr:ribosomal RNA processing protein 36 homolog isoform X2 [Acropora millepora]
MERSKLSRPSSSATEGDTSVNDEQNKIGHLREELSDIPFCELEELKQTLGCKKYNKTVYGMLGKKIATAQFTTREDKNKPKEISSKMKVPRLRQVIQVKKRLTRDPRFDDLSGTFHPDKFDKAYEFLEDMKATEKKELKKELQTTEEQDRKEQLKSLLSRMEEQEAAKKVADTRREAERKRRKAEMELVKQGKRPFFLKKCK